MPLVVKSWVMMPNEDRNTHFGRKFQARPSLGWKLFQSPLASDPVGWIIAPIFPVSGSTTVGLNCDSWPYLVPNGDSYAQRKPMFRVRFLLIFQSSCRYK